MTVDTRKISTRRSIQFNSYPDITRDADQITARPHRTVGNWTPGQILTHLARSLDASIDGTEFKVAWPMRKAARWFFLERILRKGMPAGYKIPPAALPAYGPGEAETDAALKCLHDAVQRIQAQPYRAPHPIFGRLSAQQWDQLHLRHAELHLSFIVPD